MLLLFKVIDSERAQVFSRLEDHEVVLVEKLFNQVNTHSLVQWSVVLNAFQKNKMAADDQTLYVFNAGKNLTFLYQINLKNQTVKIDAVPYGNMIWDEEVFFLDALAEIQKLSKSLPKGLLERIPDFKGDFRTEVTLHFSLNCAGKIGLAGLIGGSIKENRMARQKLIEMSEPYAKNLSKSFLRTIKFKQYTEAVQNLHPLSINLKMTFEELTEKLLFLNHANTRLKSFTQNELVQILDQIPGKELEVPTPQEFEYVDLANFLNRFYDQKFEKIKNDFQNIENKNMIIEDQEGIYHLIYAASLFTIVKFAGYDSMSFPVSFATDFKKFYLQWINMAKSKNLVSLKAKNEFDIETMKEFAQNIKDKKIFFSILNLHYLDQIEQPEAQDFFKALSQAFSDSPKSRLLLTSAPSLPKGLYDQNTLLYRLEVFNFDRQWKVIEQLIREDLSRIRPELTIELDKKNIEKLWKIGGENTFLLSALMKDMVTVLKKPLDENKILTSQLIDRYLIDEKDAVSAKKFFDHFGENGYRRLFYAATMSYLLDVPIDHFVVGMQIENHRTIKWAYQDGTFGWTRFSPETHHESLEDLFTDIKKLYHRYESYPDQGGYSVESRYVLLNHELTPPPREVNLFQLGIGYLKIHLQQHPYLVRSGFDWKTFLQKTIRERHKRNDIAELFERGLVLQPKIMNDVRFLKQFNVESFNDEIYETLLTRFPQSNRVQLENALEEMLVHMGKNLNFVSPVKAMEYLINQKEINLASYRAEQQLQTVNVDNLSQKLKKLHTFSDKNVLLRIWNVVWKFFNYYRYRNRVNDLLHIYQGIENRQTQDTLSKKFRDQLPELHKGGTYEVLLKSLEQALYLLNGIRSEYRARIVRVLTNPLSNLEEELSSYLGNIVYLESFLNELPEDAKKSKWKKMVSETKKLKDGIELELKNNGIKAIQPVKIKDAIQTLGIAVGTLTGAYSTYSKVIEYFSIKENLFKESVNHQMNVSFNYFKDASIDEKCTLANDCVLRLANLRVAEDVLDDPSDLNQKIKNLTQQKVILKTLSQLYKKDLDKKFLGKLMNVSEYNASLNIYFGEKDVDKNKILEKIDLRVKEINESISQLNQKYPDVKPQPKVDTKK